MRILVSGGRDFGKNYKESFFIEEELNNIILKYSGPYHVIQGGASGVDTCARVWAIKYDLSYTEYPAQWTKYGKKAGYLRNVQMLEEGRPDLVVCFPGGRGTEMMFDLARKAGVHVIRYLDMLTKEEHNEN